MHLRYVFTCFGTARLASQFKTQRIKRGVFLSGLTILAAGALQLFRVAAFCDPVATHGSQTFADVDFHRRVGVGAAGVINGQRRVFFTTK